jgi:hypothetical protein
VKDFFDYLNPAYVGYDNLWIVPGRCIESCG